jgi:hypothetical protein
VNYLVGLRSTKKRRFLLSLLKRLSIVADRVARWFICTHTKNVNFKWKFLVYFMAICIIRKFWSNVWQFGIYVANFVHFPRFGDFYQEKSGNPAYE